MICSCGFVISAREAGLRPSPRHQGGGKLRQVGNRGIHRARRAHFAALVMWLRLALIVPSIGDIGVLTVVPNQACAGHPQAVEVGLGQIADIEPQALRLAPVFDDELQQGSSLRPNS